MSAQTSLSARSKPAQIHDWLGVDAVNLEPVVIPPSFGTAIDAGLLPPEPQRPATPDPADDYDGLQAVAASTETAPEETDGPDCPHDPVWQESGACMLCEPAWATGEDAEAYREQNPDVYGRNPL